MRAFCAIKFLLLSFFSVGQVFQEITPTSQGLWSSAENSLGDLFMVGNNGAIINRTGGCNGQWSTVSSGSTAGFRGIVFTGDSIGILVGTSGTILRSTNHGATWTPVISGTTAGLLDVLADDSVVVAVGGGAASGNVVIRSADYGATWSTVVNNLPASPFSVAKVTDNIYVLCGVQGIVYRTVDKGLTWTAVTGLFSGTLTSVDFYDDLNGVICGQNGAVYKTTDGGLTWSQVNFSTTTFFNAGLMLKPWRYLLAGIGGNVLQTDSAGGSQIVNLNTTQAMRVICRHRDKIFIAGNQGLVYTIPYDGNYPTLFQENFCAFTDSVQPPAGWFNQSAVPNKTWRFDNPFSQTAGASQWFVEPFAAYQAGYYGPGGDSAWLITPLFSTVGAMYPLVQWNEYIEPPVNGTMTMTIQAFDGITWTTLYQSDGFREGSTAIGTGASPKLKNTARRSAVMPLPNKMDVQLRFIFSSSGASGGFWIIDDIRVINAPYDVRLDSVIYHSVCSPTPSDQPAAVVFNASSVDHYPVSSRLLGPSGSQYRTVADVVPPGSLYTLPLVTSPIAVASGDSLYASIFSWDSSEVNNHASILYTFLLSSPGFNGAMYTLCGQDTIFLTLTPDTGVAIHWSLNGVPYSNQPSIQIYQPGVYQVAFSKGTCSVTDSIIVNQVALPADPTSGIKDTFSFGETLTVLLGTADSMFVSVDHSSSGVLAQTTVSTDFALLLPATPGQLTIEVTLYVANCSFTYTKTSMLVSGLSVQDVSSTVIKIYPNPATDVLSISTYEDIKEVTIVDLQGKVLIRDKSSRPAVPVENLKAGMYILRAESVTGRLYSQKFIKK